MTLVEKIYTRPRELDEIIADCSGQRWSATSLAFPDSCKREYLQRHSFWQSLIGREMVPAEFMVGHCYRGRIWLDTYVVHRHLPAKDEDLTKHLWRSLQRNTRPREPSSQAGCDFDLMEV